MRVSAIVDFKHKIIFVELNFSNYLWRRIFPGRVCVCVLVCNILRKKTHKFTINKLGYSITFWLLSEVINLWAKTGKCASNDLWYFWRHKVANLQEFQTNLQEINFVSYINCRWTLCSASCKALQSRNTVCTRTGTEECSQLQVIPTITLNVIYSTQQLTNTTQTDFIKGSV